MSKEIRKYPVILMNMTGNKTPEAKKTDIATTLLARDYKGLNTYGFNGVIECKKQKN